MLFLVLALTFGCYAYFAEIFKPHSVPQKPEQLSDKNNQQHPRKGEKFIPLDALRHEDIPLQERIAAGQGDASQAPAELVAVYGTHRYKHWQHAQALAVSPDGKWLASAAADGVIRVRDTFNGRELPPYYLKNRIVQGLAFSIDGKELLSVDKPILGDRCQLRRWNLAKGKLISTLPMDNAGITAIHMEENLLVTGRPSPPLTLWDLATHKPLYELPEEQGGHILSLAFSPNGMYLAGIRLGQPIHVWNCRTGKLLQKLADSERTDCLAFSADGKQLFSGKEEVTVWDPISGRKLSVIPTEQTAVHSLAVSADGKWLATGGHYDNIKLWDLSTNKVIAEFQSSDNRPVELLKFNLTSNNESPSVLVSAGAAGAIRAWDLHKQQQLFPRPFVGHQSQIHSVRFSPDGSLLASAGSDGTVQIHNLATGQLKHIFPSQDQRIVQVRFSPDGRQLTAQSEDGPTYMWNLITGDLIKRIGGFSGSVCYSPDGTELLMGGRSNAKMYVCDTKTGKLLRQFEAKTTHSLYCRNGKKIISFSPVELRDAQTGELEHSFPGRASTMACSPDGNALVIGEYGGKLSLWDLRTQKKLRDFSVEKARLGNTTLRFVTFRPDGLMLATSHHDQTVRLWNIETGKELRRFTLGGKVHEVAFHPSGRYMATANQNGTVYLFRLVPPKTTQTMQAKYHKSF